MEDESIRESHDRFEIEVIAYEEISRAIESVEEVCRSPGGPRRRITGRTLVFERAPLDASTLAEAFEHPTPHTARAIAMRCHDLLLRRGSQMDQRMRTDLSAQRALCLLKSADRDSDDLEAAIGAFETLLPEFERRGSEYDWGATQLNLAEALLRREWGDIIENTHEALRRLAAAEPLLTLDRSIADWGRLQLLWAEALLALGGRDSVTHGVGRLEGMLLELGGDDPIGMCEAARAMLAKFREQQAAAPAMPSDPAQKLQWLQRCADPSAVIAYLKAALQAESAWTPQEQLRLLLARTTADKPVILPAERAEAISACEEVIDTTGETALIAAEAEECLCCLITDEAVEGLPTPPQACLRLPERLIELARQHFVSGDSDVAMALLGRAASLVAQDAGRAPAALVVEEVMRSIWHVKQDQRAAFQLPMVAQYRARKDAVFGHSTQQRDTYLRLLDGFIDALAPSGHTEAALRLLVQSLPLHKWLAQNSPTMDAYVAQILRVGELMLAHGNHSDAYRAFSDIIGYVDQGACESLFAAEARFGMGLAMLGLNFPEGAARHLKQALEQAAEQAAEPSMQSRAVPALAEALLASGNVAGARAVLQTAEKSLAGRSQLLREIDACEAELSGKAAVAADLYLQIAEGTEVAIEELQMHLRARARLARHFLTRGNLEKARSFIDQGLLLATCGAGPKSCAEPGFRELAAEVELGSGNPAKAFEMLRWASNGDWVGAAASLSVGSARERGKHLRDMRRRTERMVRLVQEFFLDDEQAIARAYLGVIRTKALDVNIERLHRVAANQPTNHPGGAALRKQLDTVRSALGRVAISPEQSSSAEIRRLSEEKAGFELELSVHSNSQGISELIEHSDFASVSLNLPEGSVLVDIIRLEDQAGGASYSAFVIPARTWGHCRLVQLGAAAKIDGLVVSFHQGVVAARPGPALLGKLFGRGATDRASVDLYDAVFEPLRLVLGAARQLVMSLDGPLWTVPFEALEDHHGGHVIDEYQVSYVSSSRAVPFFGSKSQAERTPLAFVLGAPDFQEAETSTSSAPPARRQTFCPLPGTMEEARRVGEILGVVPLQGAAASKDAVRQAGHARIVHLATHGYALRPGLADSILSDQPLLRSELALAGANRDISPDQDTGVLTAEEVLSLNCLSTELIVLSACQTGLGDMVDNEGLAGLAQSFEAAGAWSSIVSLWSVPDQPTLDLMVEFYTRLRAGEPRVTALREAKRKVRRSYPAVRDWGGFVLRGLPGKMAFPSI